MQATATLRKVGGSVMLTMPTALLNAMGLTVGATVDMQVDDQNRCLVVNPKPRPRYTLEDLLAEAESSGAYPVPPQERQWIDAPAVGRELI
jgi:antitoxin ChpS